MGRRWTKQIAALGIACLGTAGAGALATPSPFELVFDGRHVPATIPSRSGLMHAGTFDASPPFCASGSVVDLAFENSSAVTRSYTCADGSGSITVRSTIPGAEHEQQGDGTWKITAGTGRFASLRGKGIWRSVRLAGDGERPETVTFRTTSAGIADLDATAPTIAVTRASASRLARPKGVISLTLRFSARDDVAGNVVRHSVTVTAGGTVLAERAGEIESGTVNLTLRIRPSTTTRRLKIRFDASDPLDNTSTRSRSIALPRG